MECLNCEVRIRCLNFENRPCEGLTAMQVRRLQISSKFSSFLWQDITLLISAILPWQFIVSSVSTMFHLPRWANRTVSVMVNS